jgi:DNA-binding transcriptional MerR regulator
METVISAEDLATQVNHWCEQHEIEPASGQAGERLTERNIRYYRTLGLVDAPGTAGGQGYGEKHRLQLIAVRLLQAQGLPLSRIRELLFGRSVQELQRIEKQGLAELRRASPVVTFHPPAKEESWCVNPLDDEFLLVSRRGRRVRREVCERLQAILQSSEERTNSRPNSPKKER